ncbi:MAG TPA: hypothetical protein VFD92_17425 [Candidatus Binatia bacterium]|nr:hypothetical protein [Candidatus Binatia bacterium]
MSTHTEPPEGKLWFLSEGVLLAAVPGYAYALAYKYEQNYLERFGFPESLVRVDLGTVLWVLGALISSLVLVFWIANVGFLLLAPRLRDAAVARSSARVGWLALYALAMARLAEASVQWTCVAVVAAAALGALLEFGVPFLAQRRESSLEARARAQEHTEAQVGDLVDLLQRRLGASYIPVVLAVAALAGAGIAGDARARNQTTFLTLAGSTPLGLAVRVYPEYVLVASLQPDSQLVSGKVAIYTVPPDGASSISFESKELGPLQFATASNAK